MKNLDNQNFQIEIPKRVEIIVNYSDLAIGICMAFVFVTLGAFVCGI